MTANTARWLAGIGALASTCAAAQAAQPAGPAEVQGLQEIIVTAEKRSENVQNVPMSMTTFSSDALQ